MIVPGALPAVGFAALLVAAGASWAVGSVNGLTGLRQLVGEAWRQVDEELSRRQDLIPRLALTVRRHTPEQAAVGAVLAAREQAVQAASGSPPSSRAVAEAALGTALADLLAATAGHPLLAADPDYLALAEELQGTEDRITAGRRRYNDAVRVLQARLRRPAYRVLARTIGMASAEPFDADAATPSGRSLDAAPPPSTA